MDADRNTLLDLIAVINANRRCLESAALKPRGTAEKTHYRNQVRQQVAAVSRIRRDLARSDKQRAALPSRQVETYVDSLIDAAHLGVDDESCDRNTTWRRSLAR
jgi:hypothetical protein